MSDLIRSPQRLQALACTCLIWAGACGADAVMHGGDAGVDPSDPDGLAGNVAPTGGTGGTGGTSGAGGASGGPSVGIGLPDAGMNSGSGDASVDARVDSGTDADVDSGTDSGTDSGSPPAVAYGQVSFVSGASDGTSTTHRLRLTVGMAGIRGESMSASYRLRLGARR